MDKNVHKVAQGLKIDGTLKKCDSADSNKNGNLQAAQKHSCLTKKNMFLSKYENLRVYLSTKNVFGFKKFPIFFFQKVFCESGPWISTSNICEIQTLLTSAPVLKM